MFFRMYADRKHNGRLAHVVLLCMGLFDEIAAGLPIIALPLLRDRLSINPLQIGLLFTAGALSSLLLDPLMNLASDDKPKKPWVLWGLGVLAVAALARGLVTNYVLMMVIYMVTDPAVGVAVGLAQAALVEANSGRVTNIMTRWTLLSSIGDTLSPLLVAAFLFFNLGWFALCVLEAGIWSFPLLIFLSTRFPDQEEAAQDEVLNKEALNIESEEAEPGRWASFRAALRDPLLMRWMVITHIPDLLDEIFLGFFGLYLHDVLKVSAGNVALILLVPMLASIVGLLWLEWRLKKGPVQATRVLFWLGLLALIGVGALLLARTLWVIVPALLIVSLSWTCWYPLAKAEAYACKPGHTGVVRAVLDLFGPFRVALPGMIGLIAGTFGLFAGISVLCTAPVWLLLLLPYRKA